MLANVKCSCPPWFGLLHPHLLLDTKELLAELGGRDSTKVLSTYLLRWELPCSKFYNTFEPQGTPLKIVLKYKIDLLLESTLAAKRYYKISPVELFEVRKHLDKYLKKGWISPSTSFVGLPYFLLEKIIEPSGYT